MNVGIQGSFQSGKTSLLRRLMRYIQVSQNCSQMPLPYRIQRTDFSGEGPYHEDNFASTISPNRVFVVSSVTPERFVFYAAGGNPHYAVVRMGAITVGRIAQKYFYVFSAAEPLEAQDEYFLKTLWRPQTDFYFCISKIDTIPSLHFFEKLHEIEQHIIELGTHHRMPIHLNQFLYFGQGASIRDKLIDNFNLAKWMALLDPAFPDFAQFQEVQLKLFCESFLLGEPIENVGIPMEWLYRVMPLFENVYAHHPNLIMKNVIELFNILTLKIGKKNQLPIWL